MFHRNFNRSKKKSSQLGQVADELDKLGRETETQTTNALHEKTKSFDKSLIEHLIEQERRANVQEDKNQLKKNVHALNESLEANSAKWHDELNSLRNEILLLNQSSQMQELIAHFEQLSILVHSSTDKTSAIVNELKQDLKQIQSKIDACNCSKGQEHVQLKSDILHTDQQITQSNNVETSTIVPFEESNKPKTSMDVSELVDVVPMDT